MEILSNNNNSLLLWSQLSRGLFVSRVSSAALCDTAQPLTPRAATHDPLNPLNSLILLVKLGSLMTIGIRSHSYFSCVISEFLSKLGSFQMQHKFIFFVIKYFSFVSPFEICQQSSSYLQVVYQVFLLLNTSRYHLIFCLDR